MIAKEENSEADEPPDKLRFPDMRFLKSGYFSMVVEEVVGKGTGPARRKTRDFLTTNALDFFCVPVLLERAKKHGIPVTEFHITTQCDFKLPAIIYPINPFMYTPRIVRDRKRVKQAMVSLTRNHTYPVCVEPFHGKLRKEIVIYGRTRNEKFEEIGDKLWKTFRIPLFVAYFFETRKCIWLSGAVPFSDTSNRLIENLRRKKWRE
ncbi:MAG: RimK-like ATPgrasp N-terminal domain-containing protein [Thermoplasmata archaeon]|nr:RimK-like ATPgrasp N-terminal domain-containing protein [Thermoplasmata archaeon]